MAILRNVVGLDLGSHSLKAVEFRQGLRELEPVQFRVEPRVLPDVPDADRIAHFIRDHALPAHQIFCAVPGRFLSTRNLEFPFADRRRLDRAMAFEVAESVPFDTDALVIDWEMLRQREGHALVTAAMASREDIGSFLETFDGSDFEPRCLEADGLVLANLGTVFDLGGRHLLADIGHRTTRLTLLLDGRPALVRSLPGAGEALTEALAEDRGLSLAEAETAKCEEEILTPDLATSSPRVFAFLDRLAREIVRTLENSVAHSLPGEAQVTLVGGTSHLRGLDSFLSQRTGTVTRRLSRPTREADEGLVAGGDPALFATALSLALRGTARATTTIDFRRDEFAVRFDFRRFVGPDLHLTAALAGLIAVLLLVGFGSGIVLHGQQSTELRNQTAQLYRGAFPDQPVPRNPIGALRQQIDATDERADFLGAYGPMHSALDLLAEISRRVPTELDVSFDELNIDRRVIRIKVHAESFEAVDRLTGALVEAPSFRDTKVAGDIQNDKRRGGVTFNLNIPIDRGGPS